VRIALKDSILYFLYNLYLNFVAMDAVGQARFELPEHFIGGNPLLKPST
jgi:hypothetical protein